MLLPLLSLWLGARDLRQDELRCEEAVQRLSECCPGFNTDAVDCTYTPPGCGEPAIEPAISESAADEIFQTDCNDMWAAGYCSQPWRRQ